jgi:hypothetical protein
MVTGTPIAKLMTGSCSRSGVSELFDTLHTPFDGKEYPKERFEHCAYVYAR